MKSFKHAVAMLFISFVTIVAGPASLSAPETGLSQDSGLSASPVGQLPSGQLEGKKIFWISSYHQGYEANDDIERGIRFILRDSGIQLQTFFMDTKRNDSEEFGRKAGLDAMAQIKVFQPDVVIASDDNAQKYLVVPFLRNTEMPVVFCGVNWDASAYGYPAPNVTGMIEVDLTSEMLKHMRAYARGTRIGYLSGDVDAERIIVDIYNRRFFNGAMKSYLVDSMAGFKAAFLKAQQEVDMLYIYNYTGIRDWNRLEAELFLARNTRIPTGSHNGFMSPFVVFAVAKSLREHGEYAAQTAIRFLQGERPADIPLTENRKAELFVNLRMAKAAAIVPSVALMKTATVVGQASAMLDDDPSGFLPDRYQGKKILWVDSYHQGYEWSDEVEKGIRGVLYESGAEFRVFRMDTKRNDTVEYGRKAGEKAWQQIREFDPDVVIASDDNAQKYLVVPYLKQAGIPVVFCGVNWDATVYGYPAGNITGMIEEDLTAEMLRHFGVHARGKRIGYLSGNVETERKIVDIYNKRFFNGEIKPYLVETMEEFRAAFLQAQKEVDMLYIYNYAGIRDWDPTLAEDFLVRNTKIPTGSHNGFMDRFVVFTVAKSSEEQGNFAAKTALRILDGTSPAAIPIKTNELSHLTVNLKMAQAAGIVLPFSQLTSARVIGHEAIDGPGDFSPASTGNK